MADTRTQSSLFTLEKPNLLRGLEKALSAGARGGIRIADKQGRAWVVAAGDDSSMADMTISDWVMYDKIRRWGDVGLGESYMDGDWTSTNLPRLIEFAASNRAALGALIYGSKFWGLINRVGHMLRRNSRSGSRRNIREHYDLGNEFYALWLDESMSYSCGLFDGVAAGSLESAQMRKMQRALDECEVDAGKKLLEIGCGWGGLAVHASRERRAYVTGLTLSHAQKEWADAAVKRASLGGSVDIRLLDYRDLDTGKYDAICSIEMFEAVGRAYWDKFFAQITAHLKPGGRACIQTIVVREELYEAYSKGSDFIQKHIFPGGHLPTSKRFCEAARRAGLEVVSELDFGLDYAKTLRLWREAFLKNVDHPVVQKFGERFTRMWDFYLAYCEAAFSVRDTSVLQFTLKKV